jgi:RNA 2',3'-cyclic 3'-phosphodiesterase
MVRVFLALELSEDIKQELKSAQDVLRECRSRLTFVDPALIHITVKFLGEVEEKAIPGIIDAVKAIRFASFSAHAGVVTVNNPRNPRTVWCAIEDNRNGERLFTLTEDALEPLGFARETRGFTPHATIARVKSFDPSLFRQLDLLKGKHYGECAITGIKLKKSTLTGKGPVYENLLEVTW